METIPGTPFRRPTFGFGQVVKYKGNRRGRVQQEGLGIVVGTRPRLNFVSINYSTVPFYYWVYDIHQKTTVGFLLERNLRPFDDSPSLGGDRLMVYAGEGTQRTAQQVRQLAHKEATRLGMQRAKNQGKHIGRPVGSKQSNEAILKKYPAVVEAIQQGLSLRKAAKQAQVSVNTVRKVKAILDAAP